MLQVTGIAAGLLAVAALLAADLILDIRRGQDRLLAARQRSAEPAASEVATVMSPVPRLSRSHKPQAPSTVSDAAKPSSDSGWVGQVAMLEALADDGSLNRDVASRKALLLMAELNSSELAARIPSTDLADLNTRLLTIAGSQPTLGDTVVVQRPERTSPL